MKQKATLTLLLVLMLTGCSIPFTNNSREGTNSPFPEPQNTLVPTTVPTAIPTENSIETADSNEIGNDIKMGNSNNNIYHLGEIAYDSLRQYVGAVSNPWIDYLYNEGFWSISYDGLDIKRISEDKPIWINIAGDYIYYINQVRGYTNSFGYIIKIKKNGSTREALLEENCRDMIVVGNWIYFIDDADSNIYKMTTNGKKLAKIVDGNCICLQHENGWVYYTIQDTETKHCTLYKINIETCTNPIKITNDFVRKFLLYKNCIYYIDYGGNSNFLYRMKEDGTDKIKLYSMLHSFSIENDKIYVVAEGEHHYEVMYEMDLDGSNVKKILDDSKLHLNGIVGIAGDYIYYSFDAGEWLEKARVKKDGSDNAFLRDMLENTDFRIK